MPFGLPSPEVPFLPTAIVDSLPSINSIVHSRNGGCQGLTQGNRPDDPGTKASERHVVC